MKLKPSKLITNLKLFSSHPLKDWESKNSSYWIYSINLDLVENRIYGEQLRTQMTSNNLDVSHLNHESKWLVWFERAMLFLYLQYNNLWWSFPLVFSPAQHINPLFLCQCFKRADKFVLISRSEANWEPKSVLSC